MNAKEIWRHYRKARVDFDAKQAHKPTPQQHMQQEESDVKVDDETNSDDEPSEPTPLDRLKERLEVRPVSTM